MNKIISKYLVIATLLLCGVIWLQHQKMNRLQTERERYEQNSSALLSEVKRMQLDSTTMALDTKSLRLTVEEYKRYRAEDAEKIQMLGIRLKHLESTARHELSVDAPVNVVLRDTVFMQDSSAIVAQQVEMQTPYIQLSGIIQNHCLQGRIHLPVTLRQAVWVEYKRRWIFWKRVKAIHQSISSDNPYVEVTYSEYIHLE